MQSLSAFVVFVFQLLVGPSATDAKQFAQLKGEWVVERAMADGEDLPVEEWKGKKVVFVSEDKTPTNSVSFGGRLRTKGNMAWLETKTLTMCGQSRDQLTKLESEYSCSFEVTGKTMKLLLARVTIQPSRAKADRGKQG